MPYKIDYPEPGTVVTWSLTDNGVDRREREFYPTFYVDAPNHPLDDARTLIEGHPLVESFQYTRSRPGWRHDKTDVLEVMASSLEAVDELTRTLAQEGRPGTFRLYNVDFNREFRYCLETDTSPMPARTPTVLRLATPELTFADGQELTEIQLDDDEQLTGRPTALADEVARRVADRDPDVLQVSTADLIPLLFDATAQPETEYALGREPGYQTLAGSSTVLSYGQVGNSPARYNVPGRAIVDESNTFWLRESNLDGILDLVQRSHKPLQETAWGSIGNILTAIQIRYAREHDVLVPWRSWRHERFKTARTLNEADRGGFTFAPDVGVHDDVHELDFSSLYPNIIREYNISPETIRCNCHPDRDDVPGLGYSICPEPGYLPDVLGPLIDDRDDIKARMKASDDPLEIEALEGQSSAIKWILVSCFGYQGFANAKFGRIECHEAINAYAREIILDAKHRFEQHGWQIVHGIVDSLWVKPLPDHDPSPLDDVATEITEEVGVRLEYEAQYDWIAFCPRRTDNAGALTRYFGKKHGEPIDDPGSYKYRGIEVRQRSTPPYFERVQQALIETYARTRDPEAVVVQLQGELQRLNRGDIPAEDLVIKNRVSKPVDEYTQSTRNVAALYRSRDQGLEKAAGQNVEYVVVDDEKSGRERVQLRSEEPTTYDPAFYKTELVRVAESVLSPMGWKRERIEAHLADRTNATLTTYE